MISYYSAVFLAALLMLGLLMYAVRKRNNNLKPLVLKVVGLTTVIALLLPTFLNNLTLIQTALLMALLAALAGALVPVVELLPQREAGAEEEKTSVMKVVTEKGIQDKPETVVEPGLSPDHEVNVEDEIETEVEKDFEEAIGDLIEKEVGIETEEELDIEKMMEMEVEPVAQTDDEPEEVSEAEVDEEIFTPVISETSTEDVGQDEGKMVLPDTFSETMAEVMLMNGYLALKDDEEEAIDSFIMVCQRALVTDQRMMAYMELKRLLPEIGKTAALIQLGESLLEGKVGLTSMQTAYIEKHTHYLKRLASLLNAHGVTLEQPYSAMPDELKEMAMTYQE